ncbi:DUF2101 family protein [Pyrococcus horikoshii]|uniref:DUF2101 domain-containing protein n=2 Tax=Pyrococcus horikoshii TaxID=53953 RepID=O59069_PYRHO|nr:DUF2101 family protein [Pyrococcus horikoshii]BAA30450.1 245aa long hypothetical protein [Pyrococcus horikoshii OT3]HII60347.1 DUF2101 family protein [Pyrococcus horikoshii]
MSLENLLYSIGLAMEKVFIKIKEFLLPKPTENPESFRFLRKLVKRNITYHELVSLRLQLIFIIYLISLLLITMLLKDPLTLLLTFVIEFLYIRYTIIRNWNLIIGPRAYRFFYYGISTITFVAFLGYVLIRKVATELIYYLTYISSIFVIVVVFRYYFKHKFGRDYTYGIIEEVKEDLVRVFVHDDIAANVKPGYYWVPKVSEAKEGDIVKLLVENRTFRSSIPVRILEVSQSSQTSTEPKEESE